MPDDLPDILLVTARGGHGLTPAQVRSAKWLAPSRGVRINRDVERLDEAMLEAAVMVCTGEAILSDTAAAHWWGLPLPPWLGLNMAKKAASVAVPAGGARPQRTGVRGRRLALPDEHVTEFRGQRVTTVARTFVDCAEVLPTEHLIALGDFALRHGMTSRRELSDVIEWGRGRRGIRRARLALPHLDAGAESPGESLVRAHLVLAGVPRPRCNLDVHANGVFIGRVDLAWPDQLLIVEYDGAVHLEDSQRKRDARRRNELQEEGWLVITFTSADLKEPWRMVAQVNSALNARSSIRER